MNKIDPRTKRKYNLHYKARKAGFGINAKEKTIIMPQSRQNELRKSYYLRALKGEYNYKVQLSI